MAKLKRDQWWLWGQDPGSHHLVVNAPGKPKPDRLPGVNKMTPEEGGRFFGIHNMCRIGMFGKPEPPFDNEMDKLKEFPKVAFSIIGDNGSLRNDDGGDDLEEVIKLKPKYPNLVAGVMDDFFSDKRKAVYTPDVVQGFADRLHAADLDLWCVIYEFQLLEENIPWLHTCDVVTTWNWRGYNFVNLEEDFEKLRTMMRPDRSCITDAICSATVTADSIPMKRCSSSSISTKSGLRKENLTVSFSVPTAWQIAV